MVITTVLVPLGGLHCGNYHILPPRGKDVVIVQCSGRGTGCGNYHSPSPPRGTRTVVIVHCSGRGKDVVIVQCSGRGKDVVIVHPVVVGGRMW